MNIAFVASEVYPFAKTGGLADVSGALPKSLAQHDVNIKVFMPLYSQIDKSEFKLKKVFQAGDIPIKYGSKEYYVKIYKSIIPGSNVDIYFIDSPIHYNRETLYTIEPDEAERFGLFNVSVLEVLQRLQWSPDIIHCNDWQTGLIPLLVKENYAWDKLFAKTKTIFTIHNIAYQGIFSTEIIENLKLNRDYFYPQGPLEYNGEVNFLKCGLIFSDIITTVSKTYAKEILTEEFGAGMQDILGERKNDVHGILNGVDYSEWCPESDKVIPYNFSLTKLAGKKKNKQVLLKEIGFEEDIQLPLIGIVSRMVEQKGVELIMESIEELMKLNVRWAVIGSGIKEYEEMFLEVADRYSDRFFLKLGYDNKLAHLIEAGSDLFLMPSRYEPCGLNQIYSLKYGTVPIVRSTGGLADTVHDSEGLNESEELWTGFAFKEFSSAKMFETITRALKYYDDKKFWKKIVKNGMQKNYSWDVSANKYIEIYELAINSRKESNV